MEIQKTQKPRRPPGAGKPKNKKKTKGKRVTFRGNMLNGNGDYNLSGASNSDLVKEGTGRIGSKIWTTLFGNGDYTPHKNVQSNSLMSHITANGPPSMSSDGLRRVRMSHRESLGKVLSSVDFTSRAFPINPGVNSTFPWLNGLAHSFQQYELKGMVFEFLSTSADALASTNTALGMVFMVTNYDSVSPLFTSRTQMENTEFCSVTRPSRSMLHPIECKPSLSTLKTLYIRGETDTSFDLRLYDFGRFQIATEGMQLADVEIGELWVSYDVDLLKPIDQAVGGASTMMYMSTYTNDPPTSYTEMFANMLFLHNDIGLTILPTLDGLSFPYSSPGDKYVFTLITRDTVFAGGITFELDHGVSLLRWNVQQDGEYYNDVYDVDWYGQSHIFFILEITATTVDPLNPPYFQMVTGSGGLVLDGTCSVNVLLTQLHDIGVLAEALDTKPKIESLASKLSKSEKKTPDAKSSTKVVKKN